MFVLPTSNHLRRNLLINHQQQTFPKIDMEHKVPMTHYEKVRDQLRKLGVSKLAMLSMESRYLPKIIHEDEVLGGVVYGMHKDGYVMLVATDRRVIFLDVKLLFINRDDITYHVVAGVDVSKAGYGATVVLHTRIKDFQIHSPNTRCAEAFVDYVEARCLEHKNSDDEDGGFGED